MSKTSDWQHVGRNKPKSKVEKEQAFKRMPKVKDLDYSTRQDLLFQYDAEEMKKTVPLRDRSNKQVKPATPTDDAAKGDLKQVNKKKPKKSAPQTIDKALKNENFFLEKKLEATKSSFPSDVDIWFKETASYLNMNLKYPDEQLIPGTRPFDFPLSFVKENTAKALKDLYSKELPASKVCSLFSQYVAAMLDGIAKDMPTWGYKLCIQALAHTHPDLCCQELKQQEAKLKDLHNVPKQCSALLWAFGQTGLNSRTGMKVWLELMLPNLQYKSVSQFAMPYIEMIFQRTKKPQQTFASAVKAKEFLEITKWTFGDVSVKGSVLIREKMKKIYPVFQELVTGSKAAMKNTFTGIIERSTRETLEQSNKLSEVSVVCLAKEQSCFKLWREKYKSRMSQSRVLLSYLEENWDTVCTKLPRAELKNTLKSFVTTNSSLESEDDDTSNTKDFVELKNLCENLNARLQLPVVKSRSSKCNLFFWATLLALIALGVGLVLSDIKTHGGKWEKSDTYNFLKTNGVIAVTDHLWAKVQHFYRIVSSWLVTNVPVYYRTASGILGPYFSELTSYLYSLVVLIAETTKPAATWLLDQTQELLLYVGEWLKILAVHFLDYLDVCVYYTRLVAIWGYQQISLGCSAIYQLYTGEITWIEVKSAIVVQSNFAYEFLMKLLQRVGNYIAPDEP